VVVGLALAVGLATALAPFASPSPDGLEKVAQGKAFAGQGRLHELQRDAPLADYAFPGIADERVATGMAGFTGTLAVFAAGWVLVLLLRRRRPRDSGDPWPASTPST
jgi:hypothetical protein